MYENYEIYSNRESGYGRYDIMMIPKKDILPGIIIEFKKVNSIRNETIEVAVERALIQIEEKNYMQKLINLGITNVMEVGIAFKGKDVKVRSRTKPF